MDELKARMIVIEFLVDSLAALLFNQTKDPQKSLEDFRKKVIESKEWSSPVLDHPQGQALVDATKKALEDRFEEISTMLLGSDRS